MNLLTSFAGHRCHIARRDRQAANAVERQARVSAEIVEVIANIHIACAIHSHVVDQAEVCRLASAIGVSNT